MPGRDGTGPTGNNGCLTNQLPRGYFRNNRGTGLKRLYGRGGGFGRGRGMGRGIGFASQYAFNQKAAVNYTKEEAIEEIKYLKEEKKNIDARIQGLEKLTE